MKNNEILLPHEAIGEEDDYRTFNLQRNVLCDINFVALDFETATSSKNSVCEIGIAVVKNGILFGKKTWRVKPPNNQYNGINIAVHGIRPEDTINCKEFNEIWSEVCPYLEKQLIVIHNSAFDSYVLYESLLAHSIPFPTSAFICSYRLAKCTFTALNEFGLSHLCKALNIPFTQHHNAGADAVACAEVFLRILEENATETYASLLQKHNYRIGRFSPNYFRPFRETKYSSSPSKKTRTAKKAKKISPAIQIPQEETIFFGKTICFTGESPIGTREEMRQIVINLGATPHSSVTQATDFLIVGSQVSEKISTKHQKALDMQVKGHSIQIIPIEKFMDMLRIYHASSQQ